MTEWRKTKKYNPSGPGYPEAGEYYVLKSEAEEKIAELEKMVIAEQEASQAMTDRWAEANTRIRELNKALERAREQMIDQAERTEAAEAKLEKVLGGLEEIARSGDIEGFGEFIRGQASGWNQCRTQVQAIIKEVRDAN